MKMKSAVFIYVAAFLWALNAFSGPRVIGNGGDICENRFKTIRQDIQSWIERGGSSGLSLPAGASLEQYNAGMLAAIAEAQVRCTDSNVIVGKAEKTCMNFVDTRGVAQILCNRDRFANTNQSEQYVLVHHEYAGLAGIEIGRGEDSIYPVSNQITDYLEDVVVKKLAVKAPRAQKIAGSFFVGKDPSSSKSVDPETGEQKRNDATYSKSTAMLKFVESNVILVSGVYFRSHHFSFGVWPPGMVSDSIYEFQLWFGSHDEALAFKNAFENPSECTEYVFDSASFTHNRAFYSRTSGGMTYLRFSDIVARKCQ